MHVRLHELHLQLNYKDVRVDANSKELSAYFPLMLLRLGVTHVKVSSVQNRYHVGVDYFSEHFVHFWSKMKGGVHTHV